MPDILTAAERAAIAAYSGGVQRIPRGVSSVAPGEPILSGVSSRIQQARKRAKAKAVATTLEMHAEGYGVEDIAVKTGKAASTISAYLREAGA